MKSYKIRSLIYLGCFIAAGVVYYNMEQRTDFENHFISTNVADLDLENTEKSEKLPEEQKKEKEQLP